MSTITGILEYLSVLKPERERARTSVRSMLGKADTLAGRQRGLVAICDQGLVSVTNFATAVIIGRVCGKAELGAYTLAWTLMTLATDISGMLTTTPYTVLGPQLSQIRRTRYLGSLLVHQFLLSIMFALAMAAGAVLASWQRWLSDSVLSVVMTTSGVIVFICLREFVRRVSFAELRVAWALAVDVTACFIQAVGMLALFQFGALNASRTFILLGVSAALVAGGWLFLQRGAFRPDARLYARDFKRSWSFSKWVLGSGVLSAFPRYLYPWLLAAFHGTAVTGAWAACSAIVAFGNPVVLGIGNYVLPSISNTYASSGIAALRRHVQRSSLLFTFLLAPIVLVLAGGGERIVTGIYGARYAGNADVLTLLALNMLAGSLAGPYSQGLFSLGCAKQDTAVNVVWVTILFAIGIVAVKSYGALGGAAALLVSSILAAALRIKVFAHEIDGRL